MALELDTFDTEENTRPDMNHDDVRRRRRDDPWETVGNLLAEMVQVQRQLKEWRETAGVLNTRLARIEKLLYGSAGSAALMVLEYLARRLGLDLLP